MYTNSPQRMHTELMPNSLALIIPSLRETEAGLYSCTATYANSEKLFKSVRIETIGEQRGPNREPLFRCL